MRILVCASLLLPALLLAAPTQPVTVLPDEGPIPADAPRSPVAPARVDGGFVIGTVDTIGGTTFDWQANGPALRMLVNSPDYGIHALWMYSAADQTTHPDRNMRYNFYDKAAGAWNWIDPDFMQSGVNVYTDRTGFGALDVDPASGVAVACAHHATSAGLAPVLGRDMAPGAGIFEYCVGEPTIDQYAWAYPGCGPDGDYHLAMFDNVSQDYLLYSRTNDFSTWETAVSVPAPQPEPMFPNHNIAKSKTSGKLAITWEYSEGAPDPGFYRMSTDAGVTWGNSTEIPWPPAFGGDSATSFHITSLYPFFDKDDEFHVMANVMPFVAGTGYIIPAQLWHWSEANTPNWAHVMTATCDPNNLLAAVGYNAMYACRPSLGEDGNGNLFVTWEQFDSSNVEPGPPERLRADIFYSNSTDNGATWIEPVKITDGGTVSHRFPCMLDPITDTVMVSYEIDQYAGFFLYAEGPVSNNPIVVQKWANPYGGGIKAPKSEPLAARVTATPNPFSGSTRLSYVVPRAGAVALGVYDAGGRLVRTLASGSHEPGRYTVAWDGRSDLGGKLAAGVYLYKYTCGGEQRAGRLVLAQ